MSKIGTIKCSQHILLNPVNYPNTSTKAFFPPHQLLNQFENTGPPPADKEKIKNLPSVEITDEHVGE